LYPAGKVTPVGVLVLGLGEGEMVGDGLLDPEDDPVLVLGVTDGLPDGPVLGLPDPLWPLVGLLPCALEVPGADAPPEPPCFPVAG
jgi:hypothetical protein